MSARRILLLGNLKSTAMAALEGAARQINAVLTHHSRADEAIRELDVREWRAVLVDITTPGASRFCHEARARRALFNVPLIGMTPQLSDLAFSNAFRWGADDVVLLGLAAPLVARLQSLPQSIALEDAARGEAVVADADRGRCDVLGRVLANAGYSVRYATDLVSARYYIGKRGVTLFVINEELGSPPALIEQALAQGSTAYWIVAAKQRHLEELRDDLKKFERVAVMSSHGPPENVLFALDFLNPSPGALRRSQVRALHGTMVHFRAEGEEEDECGYTYSVSASGLYVRTLLPPPTGNLWLEVEPPKAARRVRLLGSVAWSRTFGQSGAETAPPGFGVRLMAGLGSDLDIWLEGFRTLDAAQPDSHVVPEVKFTPQPFKVPLPATLSQPPRTPYVSRKSSPIISIVASEPAKPSVAPTVPYFPSAAPERAVVPPLSPSLVPLLEALNPIEPEGPPRTEALQSRIPRPDPGTLRGSLAPLLNQRLASELTPPAAKLDLSKTLPLIATTDSTLVTRDSTLVAEGPGRTNGAVRATPLEAAAEAWAGSPNGPPTVEVLESPALPVLESPVLESPPRDVTAPPKPVRVESEHHEHVPPPVIVLGPDALLPLEPEVVQPAQPAREPEPLPPAETANPDHGITRNSHTEVAAERHPSNRPLAAAPGTLPSVTEPPFESVPPPVAHAPFDRATSKAAPPLAARALDVNSQPTETTPALAREARPPPRAPSSLARAAMVALGLVLVTVVLGVVWLGEWNRAPRAATPPEPAVTAPAPSGHVASTAPKETLPNEAASAGATLEASPLPAPSEDVALASASTEAPSPPATTETVAAEASPTGSPEIPETPPPSLTVLAEDESWLRVSSPVDAAVFVHGIDLGRTNQWLKSRCGMRFIRLGAAPGQWLSEGMPYRLACRSSVSIAIEPMPSRR